MGSPMAQSHLTLGELEWSKSRSLVFCSHGSYKAADLGHMLLLHTNRKSYTGMRNLTSSSDFTLRVLARPKLRSRRL